MELIEKFKVLLKPDTAQAAYEALPEVEVTVDLLEFTDGSIRVVLPNIEHVIGLNHRYLQVECFAESMDDFMIVSQIKEIVDRLSRTPKTSTLKVLSTLYTRYDRPMFPAGNDGFGAKCAAQMINSLNFNFVNFIDCHSDVMIRELNHGIVGASQMGMASDLVGDLDFYSIVAPDKGALTKNPHADVVCHKVRDTTTGRITGMELIRSIRKSESDPLLVIDDICEGGRTFIGVAELLEEKYPNVERELYITHGVFSNAASIVNLCEKYSKIHVYIMRASLYNSLHEFEQNKLNVKYLVNV